MFSAECKDALAFVRREGDIARVLLLEKRDERVWEERRADFELLTSCTPTKERVHVRRAYDRQAQRDSRLVSKDKPGRVTTEGDTAAFRPMTLREHAIAHEGA